MTTTASATGALSWVPTVSGNVYRLNDTGRPTTDLDGGPLGRDPALPPLAFVVSPTPASDPAVAALGPTTSDFGKWGTVSGAAAVTLTYSFFNGAVAEGNDQGRNLAALDSAHQETVRVALAAFAAVANITFVEITETATGGPTHVFGASGALVGNLRFADDLALNSNGYTAAYAQEPAGTVTTSGLVAFDVDRNGVPDDLTRGARLFGTIVHEIGHALGLSHPFDGADAKPSAGDPRSGYGAWSTNYTMMSYTSPSLDVLPFGQQLYNVGPQVGDIAILQSYYGANRTVAAGDTVYRLDGKVPAAAVWDAGGTDTIDASAAAVVLPGEQGSGDVLRDPGAPLPAAGHFTAWTGVILDLRAGTVGPHLSVAHGVALENAIGSRGGDLIIGTDPGTLTAGDGSTVATNGANFLDGGPGNDTIMGLGGDDTLVGGAGFNLLDGGDGYDTALYTVASTTATVTKDGTDLIVTTANAVDRLRNIEALAFSDRTVAAEAAPVELAPPPQPQPQPTDTPQSPVIDPARQIAVWSNGESRFLQIADYVGPVTSLRYMHIGDGATEAIVGTDSADFIHGMGGDDALAGGGGDDVLDGGLGSNFLTGGAGKDTFFVDGRGGGVTWSTVTDLEAGEWVTAWGWQPGKSTFRWEEMSGAEGYKGATAHIDLDNNGIIDMSMTISGRHSGAVTTTFGLIGDQNYMAFTIL
ncbi:serralysin [Azospirillum brasilense]|nr:serralysin [Azospirillum brasilense]